MRMSEDIWQDRCKRCGRPLDRFGHCSECDSCGYHAAHERVKVKK